MEPELLDILREAVKTRQRKEGLERALGRTLRRRNLDFRIYVQIMSELRGIAEPHKMSVDEAAAKLLAEKK